jgi:hypothetical protein
MMYEERPGYPGHNTTRAGGGYYPKGSNNSYQNAGWFLQYPKGRGSRGKAEEGLQPHASMLQDTGRRGGSGSRDVSLVNLLKRWEVDVWVVPDGTEYKEGIGFLGGGGGFGMGTRMRVRVGDLPGLTEMLVEMAAKAEPRVYRRWR